MAGHIGNEDFGLSSVNTAGGPILQQASQALRIDFQGQSDRAFGAALGPSNTVTLVGDSSDGAGSFHFGVARYIAPGNQ